MIIIYGINMCQTLFWVCDICFLDFISYFYMLLASQFTNKKNDFPRGRNLPKEIELESLLNEKSVGKKLKIFYYFCDNLVDL